MDDHQKAAFYLLKMRDAIALKEWAMANANHDLQRFGEWSCDWNLARREAQEALDAAETALRSL